MYEFVQTEKGWLVYWGPPPVQTRPEVETNTFPASLFVQQAEQAELSLVSDLGAMRA